MTHFPAYTWLIALGLWALGSGCTKPLEFDPPAHEPRLTLNALLSPQQEPRLYLFQSLGIDTLLRFEAVEQAQLTISRNGVPWTGPIRFEAPTDTQSVGYYAVPDLRFEGGDVVRITAQVPGLPPIEAQDTFPEAPRIDEVRLIQQNLRPINDTIQIWEAQLAVSFTDPPEPGNFYTLGLRYAGFRPNGGIGYDPERLPDGRFYNLIYYTTEDPSATIAYIRGDNYVYDDRSFNGKQKDLFFETFSSTIFDRNPLDTVLVELSQVSRAYYEYQRSYSDQYITTYRPFTEPVSVFSNVTDGYGILATYHTIRDTLVLR